MNGPEEQGTGHGQRAEGPEGQQSMVEFERALSRAMRRVEVRAEMSAKLLALAEEAERRRVHAGGGMRLLRLSNGGRVIAMRRMWARSWMDGAIAAVLALGCFVGAHVHEQHERRVEAQKQFETAERITDQTLERTRAELARQGVEF